MLQNASRAFCKKNQEKNGLKREPRAKAENNRKRWSADDEADG